MKVKFNIKRYFQVLGMCLALVAIVGVVCWGMDLKYKGEVNYQEDTAVVEASAGKINVLLMGVDVDGLRTDAIMLASCDTETGVVNMLSIPRDTKMYVGNRYQKINAAHAFEKDGKIGGPDATVEAVTRLTGIPINYYVDFSFDAVAHVINELGPINFTIPDLYGDGVGMVYDDPVQGLHINLPPGNYDLDGTQAVWLMRYRHGNYDPEIGGFKGYENGDADRVEMQQQFIKAVVEQKVNASLVLKVPAIFKTISNEIKTNFTVSDVVKYSKYITNFSSENIHAYSLPGEFGEDEYNGSVWLVHMQETKDLVRSVFGYDADRTTVGDPEKDGAYANNGYGGSFYQYSVDEYPTVGDVSDVSSENQSSYSEDKSELDEDESNGEISTRTYTGEHGDPDR